MYIGEIILREFEDSSDAPSSYCTCRSNRVNSLTVRTCRKTCSADDEECDAPRWCQGASSSGMHIHVVYLRYTYRPCRYCAT